MVFVTVVLVVYTLHYTSASRRCTTVGVFLQQGVLLGPLWDTVDKYHDLRDRLESSISLEKGILVAKGVGGSPAANLYFFCILL